MLNVSSISTQPHDSMFDVVDGSLAAVEALGPHCFRDFPRAHRARKLKDAPISRLDALLFASPNSVDVQAASNKQFFGHFRTQGLRISAQKRKFEVWPRNALICLFLTIYMRFRAITNTSYIGFESR
jgi:hypothetical protein